MSELDQKTKDILHGRLIKLGDMMGDGLHHESDGKWISREYRKTLRALGMIKPKKRNVDGINDKMKKRVADVKCKCGGVLVQTRSGSKRGRCLECKGLWQLLK